MKPVVVTVTGACPAVIPGTHDQSVERDTDTWRAFVPR